MAMHGIFGASLDRIGGQMESSFQALQEMSATVDPNNPESVAKFTDAYYSANEQLSFYSTFRSSLHNLCTQILNNLK